MMQFKEEEFRKIKDDCFELGRAEMKKEILEIIDNLPCYPAREVGTGNIEPFIIIKQLKQKIKEQKQ